jgi:hypothetical protein
MRLFINWEVHGVVKFKIACFIVSKAFAANADPKLGKGLK